jgi:hypothetical protein
MLMENKDIELIITRYQEGKASDAGHKKTFFWHGPCNASV